MASSTEIDSRNQSGFTIVEVMIVLAIAGLVLAIVFIAVPALQRNARNTQRRADLGQLRAQFDTWTANNGGKIPDDNNLDDLNSIINGTAWGHYNGNGALPGRLLLNHTTPHTCDWAVPTPFTQTTCENGPDMTASTADDGMYTAAVTSTETEEYTIGYAKDLSAADLAAILLPDRQEIHVFGEMSCAVDVLADGNDEDDGGTATYAAAHADVELSNARALAFIYQIEGEDNARCEDNV